MGIATKHPFSNGRMPRTRMGKSEVMNKPRPVRPIERQPMKEWLQVLLNDNAIPHQLSWLDKNKREFRINWRHGSRHGWSMKDVELYKRWAIHTGRFDEHNQDTKRWKANFRCALNSLSDVKEQKDSGVKKGANAFKVYKITDQGKDSRASRKRCKQEASDDEIESKRLKPNSNSSEDVAFSPVCSSLSSPSYDSTIGSPSTSSMSSSSMSPPSATFTLHMTRPNGNPTTVEFGKMISIPLHHCGFVMLKPSDLAGTIQRQRETFDTGKVNFILIVRGDYTFKKMFDDVVIVSSMDSLDAVNGTGITGAGCGSLNSPVLLFMVYDNDNKFGCFI